MHACMHACPKLESRLSAAVKTKMINKLLLTYKIVVIYDVFPSYFFIMHFFVYYKEIYITKSLYKLLYFAFLLNNLVE